MAYRDQLCSRTSFRVQRNVRRYAENGNRQIKEVTGRHGFERWARQILGLCDLIHVDVLQNQCYKS